jgi:hypothetical protein
MALPDYANDAAGIVGMGQCLNPATMRPCCAFWRECQRETIAGVNVVCRVQIAEEDAAAVAAARRIATAELSERMWLYVCQSAEPVIYQDVRAALPDADASLCKGAWRLLHISGRIVAVGVRRPERCKVRTTWRATDTPAPPPPPKPPRQPCGRKQKHVENVKAVLRAAGKPLTSVEVEAVLNLGGSLASNCLSRMALLGRLKRQMRGYLWEYYLED